MAKKQRHPNGQHEITIDDVQGVYNHQYPIPLRCYSFKKPRPQTIVTPKQVTKAYQKWEAGRNADAAPPQPPQAPHAQPPQAKRLHPGGRRAITIRQVEEVYAHEHPVPVRCYPFRKPQLRTMVTPEQLAEAVAQYATERTAAVVGAASTQPHQAPPLVTQPPPQASPPRTRPPQAPPLQIQPARTPQPLQTQQPPRTQHSPQTVALQIQRQIVRLHPNGRRLAAIRDVNKVYAHQRPIPLSCYPVTIPAPETMVTPEQVTEAVARHDATLSAQHDVERAADLHAVSSQAPQVPPLQTQPQQASPPLARASSPRTERLHPNGQRLIAIRDVVNVYDLGRAIPVSCYPFDDPRPETMVAPEQVVAASDQFAAEMFDQYNADRTADATDATSPQPPPQAQRSAAASESADAAELAAAAESATAAEPAAAAIEPAAASEPAVLESQALQIQQVHPNGQQLIAIRDVQQVYELQQPIPMSYYPFKEPQPQTMVTPAQVLAASARYDPEPTPTGSTPPQETQQPQPPPIQPLRLHPNGQRTIAIRDVDEVYDFDRWDHIDMEFFPRWSRPQTQITPEQLAKAARAADLHERALQAVHNIDTAFGLIPEGGLWENMYDD